ncbi:ankyrin repeat domain-containing protein [Actinopolymorpha singaporensis]|uniref:Ankyrin repeat-containing protein n=1 Tax=Actinopolymorpha singaporensis TaxID=117157 RepID=A0A1H1S3T7_9ACTN|nr:ankyrin repeat domain-containing protein [Actinopolymorpha singaporensis]SDS42667.1 Ankyrin repeat-containing protein [Actinopolymorpha singaporensis]
MPTRPLPDNPSLEHLRNQARSLQRRAQAGEAEALAEFEEFDPRRDVSGGCSLSDAQFVVARSYGFPSWQRLRAHLDVVAEYSYWPRPVDADEADLPDGQDLAALADRFLDLACLNYTRDTPHRPARARDLLRAHPEVARFSLHTMAAAGDAAGLREALGRDRSQVDQGGGPYGWPPIMYLTYARLDVGSPVEAAEALLTAGADPNAGRLWQGMTSAFTALTGAFGGGEQGQPPHPQATSLARLLLGAGADPNDNQALYNRQFTPANDHLDVLFEFGLGRDHDSPWRRRLSHTYPSTTAMVEEQLRWAADHGMTARVRLLLDHGVAPDGRGYHPNYRDLTALQLATLAGEREIARMLVDAGADRGRVDAVQEFVGACVAGDRAEVERLTAVNPALPARAREQFPDAGVLVARTGRVEAMRLLLEQGFDVNAGARGDVLGPPLRRTALHEAALAGNLPLARFLVEQGADPSLRDASFDATPLGWAEHSGEAETAAYLRGRS